MRVLVLLCAMSAVSAMAQVAPIEDSAPPMSPLSVTLRGEEGKVFLPTNALGRLAQAEPEIAAPVGATQDGMVSLRVTVSKTGAVVDAVAVQGDEALRKAAVDGVMSGWHYRPLLINGELQEFQSWIVVDFRDGVGKRATVGLGMAAGGNAGMGSGSRMESSGPVRVSSGVMGGLMQQAVAPVYPPMARAAHVQGMVILHAILSKTGDVENLRVISGPPMLVQAAENAVQQWKYRPYLLNGVPTEVETTINVNFTFAPAKTSAVDGQPDEASPSAGTADPK
jgi:TonB family protein